MLVSALAVLAGIVGILALWARIYRVESVPQNVTGDTPPGVITPSPPTSRINWMGHWLHEDKRETLVREVAAEFGFLNQNIDVNLKFPQEIMGIRSKPVVAKYIANMIRTGKINWDILWLDDEIYELVAEELKDPDWGARYLVNFAEVPQFKETQKDFIISDPFYRNHTGGIMTGPYIEGYYYVLWYNAKLAARMNLKIKQYGMTFDDLLGYVRAVQEYNEKHGTHISPFYEAADWTTMEILFQNLVKSQVDSFSEAEDETLTDQKKAALLKTFQALEQLGKYHPLIPSADHNIWFATRHLVLDDEALFYINGTWMYSHWRGIDREKIRKMVPAELPAFKPVNYYVGGYLTVWGVLKNAPNRDDAVRLVMFWSRPKIAEKWVRYTKNPTGLKGNLAVSAMGTDVFDQFQRHMSEKYDGNVHYSFNAGYILGKAHRTDHKELLVIIRGVVQGKMTAQQAYARIISRVEGRG